MKLQISNAQKTAFREIFNLVATKDGLSREGFEEIFKLIDYKLTEKQLQEFYHKLYKSKDMINFDEFMNIFNLKMADYTSGDVKNAFKLLAKEDDKFISLDLIKDILKKNNMPDMEINFIVTQLIPFTEVGTGKINYEAFLKNLGM